MAHPQIVIFARMAGENTQPARVIAGQRTLLARTMHDIRYDAVNDEILVANPFAQAIMTFAVAPTERSRRSGSFKARALRSSRRWTGST